jgi:type I restriction enzyme S subunit
MSWSTKKLGEICEIIAGQAPSSSSYNTEGKGMPFLRVNSFGNIYPRIEAWTTQSLKCSKEGDVLISVAGSVGMVNLGINACITRSIFALRPQKDITQKFLFLILKLKNKELLNAGQGSAQKIITIDQIENFQIPLPSLSIQQKIVKILDTIQEAVGVQEKLIEKTKEFKRAMMAKLFREGTRGEKLKKTEIGEIPESWEVVNFINAIDKKAKFWVGELKEEEFKIEGRFPIVDQGEEKIAAYSNDANLVYRGPLPVVIFGDHTRVIKFIDFPFVVGGSGVKILIPTQDFDTIFFYYFLSGLNIESRGYNRHFGILKEKLILKPPLPQQREIAEILQIIDQKIEIEEKKKVLYEELFRTMLNEIMCQKIDIDLIDY